MTSYSLRAIERPPALIRDQVAAELRRAISNLELRPGQMLVERELCESTTASRATVREALRQLQSEGLVVSSTGRGSFVATLTRDEAREIYEVREALEGLAGYLFAENADQHDRDALESACAEVADAVPEVVDVLRAKARFYEVLMAGSRNSELSRQLHGMNMRATLVRSLSLAQPGRTDQMIKEIRAIVKAAVTGKAERTRELCAQHVRNAAQAYNEAADQMSS
ncbi:GntR family transcriptional regulator [Sciscionella marina]|uniref:GntR family transcriptional regulator n=1 Tax=Sciscionella marina TaxID=508770 RepID=UPI000371F06F|nr:GntR family transcriptional regulator [Sciscionella marina]